MIVAFNRRFTALSFATCGTKSPKTRSVSVASIDRRQALNGLAGVTASIILPFGNAHALEDSISKKLEEDAFQAYSDQDFPTTVKLLTELQNEEPSPRWLEMRAQVLVDEKEFKAAIADYDTLIAATPAETDSLVLARLSAGRALALEGISDWEAALQGYDQALEFAKQSGAGPDPYVYNSRGNCLNSLQRWSDARDSYLVSSEIFQTAKGFRGRNGNTTSRLDGAIFSASNAALMLAQMGDSEKALKEMERIARRAPGSADMRAGLAALYYDIGKQDRAEDSWNFACDMLVVGCKKYQDRDWVTRIRRWPPVMVEKLFKFIELKPPSA